MFYIEMNMNSYHQTILPAKCAKDESLSEASNTVKIFLSLRHGHK